jgi:tetratricopeptide (TPR) repeat protein
MRHLARIGALSLAIFALSFCCLVTDAAVPGAVQIRSRSDWDVYIEAAAAAFDAKDYANAEKQAQAALQYSSRFHPEDLRVANTYATLGKIYEAQGKYEAAEAPLRKALEICRQAVREENVFEVGCLDDLAELYEAEGKYSDAEPLRKQSLKIATKVMDGKGPLVVLCAENLAQLYAAEKQFAVADELWLRSLRINEDEYGKESIQVALTLEKRASMLSEAGREREAADVKNRAAKIRKKLP